MKNKKVEKVMCVIFGLSIVVPSIIWPIAKLAPQPQLNENRELNKFPSNFNPKTFPSEFESWYNDHIPFRSSFINWQSSLLTGLEKIYFNHIQPFFFNLFHPIDESQYVGGEFIGNLEDLFEKDCFYDHKYVPIKKINDSTDKKFGCTLYKCEECGKEKYYYNNLKSYGDFPYRESGLTILGRDDWLFYKGDNSLENFKGKNLPTEDELLDYKQKLEDFQTFMEEKGKKVCYFIAPNKDQVYPEKMPTIEKESENTRVKMIYDFLKDDEKINICFPLQELKAGRILNDTYYKHDTHWNEFGGLIGGQSIYKKLGLQQTNIFELIKNNKITKNVRGFGDLINIGGLDASLLSEDYSFDIDYSDSIVVQNIEKDEIQNYTCNNPINNMNVSIIGDSFRVNLKNSFVHDFKNTFVSHINQISGCGNEEKNILKNSDIFILEVVERYESNFDVEINLIKSILQE